VDVPVEADFQHVADGKRFDRDVFLPFVGVHRSFATHRGIEFLHVRGRRFDYRAVGFADTRVDHVERFESGSELLDQQAEIVDC